MALRLLVTASAMLFSLQLFACAEPECPEGTYKVGNVCRRNDAGTDAAEVVETDTDASRGTDRDMSNVVTPDSSASTAEACASSSMDAAFTPNTSDAGEPVPSDPCEGIPNCSACTMDSQCPEPGACLTRHCNTSKGICEPAFAAAQTACGTSKCDGAGRCVGCINNSDCGEPGECKVKHCNQGTHVCEPTNASDGTACSDNRHCAAGACVQCTAATAAADCEDRTCQTKSCVSSQCRYTDTTPGQKGNCVSGVCTAALQCRECASDPQCDRLDGPCTEGVCNVSNRCQAAAKTGSCGTGMVCNGMSCERACGNGRVDTALGELCDPADPYWGSWACNGDTCQPTGFASSSFRKRCSTAANCASSEMCAAVVQLGVAGFEARPICLPGCTPTGNCPHVPGYDIRSQVSQGTSPMCDARAPCVIECTSPSSCPPNTGCLRFPADAATGLCAGSFF